MIVNQIKKGWEIIFQPAHGLLAGQIGLAISKSYYVKDYLLETIAAIESHDNHQVDFKKDKFITEVGAPKDFSIGSSNLKDQIKQVNAVTEEAFQKSCWTGALVSYHCHFLYDGDNVKKSMAKVLKKLEQKRKEIFKSTKFTEKDLKNSYDLLRFCDRCSLILTRQNIPEMGRKVEVITFHDGQKYELWKDEDDFIRVSPWLFEDDEFTVKVETKLLKKLYFQSDKALKKQIEKSKIKEKRWTFKK